MHGLVNVSQAGAAAQPSPSIWKDMPGQNVERDGTGHYFHRDFLGASTGTLAAALDVNQWSDGGQLRMDADTDTVITQKAAEMGGYLDLETDGDDNDAVAIFTMPFAKIVANSGNKVWLECRVEAGALADQGFFFGLAEEAALSRDVVADNGVALIGESLLGFRINSADTDEMDIVYKLDAGTEVIVLADALSSSQLTAAGGTAALLAANVERKLGIKFDGKETIAFYIDGFTVAIVSLATTAALAAFPDNVAMGAIMCLKTGTGAAQSIATDWIRGASMNRS